MTDTIKSKSICEIKLIAIYQYINIDGSISIEQLTAVKMEWN